MGSYQIGQNGFDLRRNHVASVLRSMVWGAGLLEGYECAHGCAWVASACIARMKSDSELVVGDVLGIQGKMGYFSCLKQNKPLIIRKSGSGWKSAAEDRQQSKALDAVMIRAF